MEIWLNCIDETRIQINSGFDYVLTNKLNENEASDIFLDKDNIISRNKKKN